MTRALGSSLALAAAALAAAGCAGVYSRGERALAEGRYVEARRDLEEAVRRAPDRVEAVTALGVAEYKLGALPEAAATLLRALALHDNVRARVYLALVRIREGDDADARRHLAALHQLHAPARLAAHAERAGHVLGPALSADLRTFVTASLEDAVEWEREPRDAWHLPSFSFQPAFMFEWSR
jgi:tetratricopeptide (TPR) repeat protein